jgi:hypothetical protein
MGLTPHALALPLPPDIAAVSARLDRWRQTRRRRARVPDALWRAATTLARQHGAGKIARLLRLDYYALRRRVGQERQAAPGASPAAFVELVPTALGAPRVTCVVECERPDGGRMRIQCTSPQLPDLAALSASFWRGAP